MPAPQQQQGQQQWASHPTANSNWNDSLCILGDYDYQGGGSDWNTNWFEDTELLNNTSQYNQYNPSCVTDSTLDVPMGGGGCASGGGSARGGGAGSQPQPQPQPQPQTRILSGQSDDELLQNLANATENALVQQHPSALPSYGGTPGTAPAPQPAAPATQYGGVGDGDILMGLRNPDEEALMLFAHPSGSPESSDVVDTLLAELEAAGIGFPTLPPNTAAAAVRTTSLSNGAADVVGFNGTDCTCEICFDEIKMNVAESRFNVCGHGGLICSGCNEQLVHCPFCRIPAVGFEDVPDLSMDLDNCGGAQSPTCDAALSSLVCGADMPFPALRTAAVQASTQPQAPAAAGAPATVREHTRAEPPPPALALALAPPAVPGLLRSAAGGAGKKPKKKRRRKQIRDSKGPHKVPDMDAKIFAILPRQVLLLATKDWNAALRELGGNFSPTELVRAKQLRRREKSKMYSQKYRDANGKGSLWWR